MQLLRTDESSKEGSNKGQESEEQGFGMKGEELSLHDYLSSVS